MSVDSTDPALLEEGARNLLVGCGALASGDSLLILHEDPVHGWYDPGLPEAIAAVARTLGARVRLQAVGPPRAEPGRDDELDAAIAAHSHALFLARIGDQDRFEARAGETVTIMSYARTHAALASPFGRAPHAALQAVKNAVDALQQGADEIEITCPLGSRLTGRPTPLPPEAPADVSVRRFPLGVPQPVLAAGFSGSVVLARFLTPTGSRPYEPDSLPLAEPVRAHIENGRILDFDGPADSVASVRAHHRHVGGLFAIDPWAVHSFHAGIHPACAYPFPAADNPDRWSNSVFCNPRFLHFHTCGAYPPAEICWMLLDPTVRLDGIPLWEHGRLRVANFAETQTAVAASPTLPALFAAPADSVGLAVSAPPA